jgi:predicted permease
VTAVGVSDSLPPAGEYRQSILNVMEVSGKPRAQNGTGGMVAMRWVTPDYFRTLGIPIVEGRGFSEGERQGTEHLMIVSRLLEARLFPGESAVGQHIRPSPNDSLYTVVGVAKDVKNAGLTGDDVPEYYRLRRNVVEDWLGNSAVLVVETSLGAEALSGAMRAEIAHIDPTVPVEIETLEGRVGKLADGPRFDAALLGFFALCALLMAVTGLYGLIAYMAQRRTNEIGVRIALGASRGEILRLIAGEGVRLVAIGCAVGVVAAYSVMQVLGSLLFNVTPRDPVILVAVGVVLAVVSIVAALIPARAAMGVDPVVALRCE